MKLNGRRKWQLKDNLFLKISLSTTTWLGVTPSHLQYIHLSDREFEQSLAFGIKHLVIYSIMISLILTDCLQKDSFHVDKSSHTANTE